MSWSSSAVIMVLAAVLGCSLNRAAADEVCPARAGQFVRSVDVFDGAPEELATLVPDKSRRFSGYWRLAYVYTAGRFVTIRCKYDDGAAADVKLTTKVHRCDYRIDVQKTLTLKCR